MSAVTWLAIAGGAVAPGLMAFGLFVWADAWTYSPLALNAAKMKQLSRSTRLDSGDKSTTSTRTSASDSTWSSRPSSSGSSRHSAPLKAGGAAAIDADMSSNPFYMSGATKAAIAAAARAAEIEALAAEARVKAAAAAACTPWTVATTCPCGAVEVTSL